MPKSLYSIRVHSRSVAIVALLLTLWLIVAEVSHQQDTTTSHHAHHQCQLFNGLQHGLAQALPELAPCSGTSYLQPDNRVVRLPQPPTDYCARSPPTLALQYLSA
ncbi:DUF2607 family protein [Vibrio sp. ABG19]|uniref:DUF2607 family protein n=1 Tax=Vibrio sp. ABG19 TaxID=2817385 RepID=UPI00249E56C0|nr:DUF2607 family protein [Vibrio sp. ABG19]WGY47982.1 DUF2607 family protein [Vibrio sp. ABG19]